MSRSALGTSKPRLALIQAGDGPAFVFQHGLCGDAAQAAEVFPDDAHFRRATLECRGHGGSDPGHPAQLSIATFTDNRAAHPSTPASTVGNPSRGCPCRP